MTGTLLLTLELLADGLADQAVKPRDDRDTSHTRVALRVLIGCWLSYWRREE